MALQSVVTPVGQAVYPKLVTPDTKFNVDGLYSCRLIVSENDYKAFRAKLDPIIEQEYEKACAVHGKQLPKATNEPCKINADGDYELFAKQVAKKTLKDGEEIKFSIVLVDSKGMVITDKPNVGSGSKCAFKADVYGWYVPSQGFGYTLRLKGVQILELVEFTSGGHGFSKESGFTTGETFNEVIIEDEVAETPDF